MTTATFEARRWDVSGVEDMVIDFEIEMFFHGRMEEPESRSSLLIITYVGIAEESTHEVVISK